MCGSCTRRCLKRDVLHQKHPPAFSWPYALCMRNLVSKPQTCGLLHWLPVAMEPHSASSERSSSHRGDEHRHFVLMRKFDHGHSLLSLAGDARRPAHDAHDSGGVDGAHERVRPPRGLAAAAVRVAALRGVQPVPAGLRAGSDAGSEGSWHYGGISDRLSSPSWAFRLNSVISHHVVKQPNGGALCQKHGNVHVD